MDGKSSDEELQRVMELLDGERALADMLEALVRVGVVIVRRLLWVAQGAEVVAEAIEDTNDARRL